MRLFLAALMLASSLLASRAYADVPDEARRTELYHQGVALGDSGDWQGAARCFRQVVEVPSAPKPLIALAIAEEKLGHLAESKRLHARALKDAEAATPPQAEVAQAARDALLIGELGEGGSGTVFAVRRDGHDLALKVLRADLALSERERQRFLAEAERMRRVSHPNVIRLVDAGALDDGRPYTMPLLRGETLAARLAKGALDRSTALQYFFDIADAVAAIHDEGLIHRDIKPENVMLETDHPVLLDLGIARDVGGSSSATTEAGGVRGTRAYMAPERFFGVTASVATDVYELAVLLYLMLVGQAPWRSDDTAASRLRPRDPSELGVELPEALKTAVLRALSTRPEMQPSTIHAFASLVHEGV